MTSVGKFKKTDRIQKTGTFRKVYRQGRSVRQDEIVFYCMPNNLGTTRIGFSISSARVKKASARNRIRRVFKEAYRRNRSNIKDGLDIVFVIRRASDRPITLGEAESKLLAAIKRLGINK